MTSEHGADAILGESSATVRTLLERSLEGRDLGVGDAELLFDAAGTDLAALERVADALCREQAGAAGTYVVNRNVNFTNVCVKACKFCAFSRTHRSEQGYFLDQDEVARRAAEAYELGATEVCIQAGLAPGVAGSIYVDLCRAVKRAVPNIHVHAFSPEEVKYGAELSGCSIRDYLLALKDAGLGSIPGTSAEILDDGVRKRLAGGRITTAEWLEVIGTAHDIGIPTTSTVMFGHIETNAELVRHLDVLRRLQRETGGITEFVPLSFIASEAPLFRKSLLPNVRPGPSRDQVFRLFAIARLFFGREIRNIQASWVKEGPERAQALLSAGANDLGGTLINESISTSAGATHGQRTSPSDLRALIRGAGRKPVQRDTLYRTLREYPLVAEADETEALDRVSDGDTRFGTYAALAADERYRFKRPSVA